MANPADDLYEIFKIWRSENGNVNSSKTVYFNRRLGAVKNERQQGWPRQRQAARCLLAIETIIEQMAEAGDNVESEREYFAQWTQAVFAYPDGWKANGNGISDSALQSLGMFRNSARRFLPEVGPDFIQELQDLLQNEPSLTPPPGEYPSELFDYFTRVKYHLKKCIDDYSSTNTFDLMRAAEDYRAAVFMMANGHFVTNPKDWGRHAAATFGLRIARKFGNTVYDEANNKLAKSTVRALQGAGQLMLESGAS